MVNVQELRLAKFQPAENAKNHKNFRVSKCVRMADFALLESPKLISHKI